MAKPKEKIKPVHLDLLGRPITEESIVAAYPKGYGLKICKIVKLNPKMIELKPLGVTYFKTSFLEYPHNTVILDGPDLTVKLLTLNVV